jgi:EAL domain-containing protein (putative c-di-GMP-specific phosphodiesterase class I)
MQFILSGLNKSWCKYLITLTTFLLFIGLGMVIISWQISQGMSTDAHQRLNQAQNQIEHVLRDAQSAVMAVSPAVGAPCSAKVLQDLRTQVARYPYIRSVSLVDNNTLYCTSWYGDSQIHLNHQNYAQDQLLVISDNNVPVSHPLMIYRQSWGRYSVLVGIDGYFIYNVLQLLSKQQSPLILEIGDHWLNGEGQVYDVPKQIAGTKILAPSSNFAYQVFALCPNGSHWHYITDYALSSLFLFPFFAIFASLLTYFTLARVTSPLALIKSGVNAHQFIPYIQPVVDANTYQLSGCEILMRWSHPQSGLITPQNFIPLAESSGLIVPMTRDIFRQVHDHFIKFTNQLPTPFHFSFNITARHCQDISLIDDCRAFMEGFDKNKVTLVLEITERELITDTQYTADLFNKLHQLGVLLAIDDFGTGHCSLAYLQQFHVDILKIDQSFIGKIGTDALSLHIVDNVIDLSKHLKLKVTAEGVETDEQARYLMPFHLDYLQGYLFGRPHSLDTFTLEWLHRQEPTFTALT